MSFLDDVLVVPDPTAVAAAVTAAAARGPVIPLRGADEVRAERSARPVPAVDERARRLDVPGPAGALPLRVIRPDAPVRAVRVTAHSSGWALGTPTQDDLLGGLLASVAGIASVSVGYRLAPEHPFPAGLDDVLAALRWVVEHGRDELGSDRVVASGASAGAHLTLLAALVLRRETPRVADRLVALDLRYGCYDLGRSPSLRAAGDDAPIVTDAGTAALLDHAFPGLDDDARRCPTRSPLYADLHGLPPTLVAVGTADALVDDSVFLAGRLATAGVETDLQLWKDCPHSFDGMSPALARAYAARLVPWLERRW